MALLIKGGKIGIETHFKPVDILIKNGKIAQIGNDIAVPMSTRVIDATDRYILPAGIDPHVHFHLPTPAGYSSDDFQSGSFAALKGGTTAIIDFVTPQRGESLPVALEKRLSEVGNCYADYSFHISPVEWNENTESEIARCIEQGFPSFKVYLAYKDTVGIDWEIFRKVLHTVGELGGIVAVHSEMGDDIQQLRQSFAEQGKTSVLYHALSRPDETEYQAVERVIQIAAQENCPVYFVHISTAQSVALIEKARQKGQKVFAETCPHYLLLDNTLYHLPSERAVQYVCSPPLREKSHCLALWDAIRRGAIQTIGTDHCPFNQSQKNIGLSDFRKIPNGVGGVEHRMLLLYHYGLAEGKITPAQYGNITSFNAARIFGFPDEFTTLAEGTKANLTLIRHGKRHAISVSSHASRSDIEINEGLELQADIAMVIKDGEPVFENGEAINLPQGRLIYRQIDKNSWAAMM